jgi:glycosyltransferase involved in cell wall biosynthesis
VEIVSANCNAGAARQKAIELSVIVPARNAAATLGEQLDALLAQEWHRTFEVVVVDNGSSDGTPAVVDEYRARDPRVRLVDASEDVGVAYCRNTGIAAVLGDGVAICDADDIVAPGWVSAMGEALRDHEFVTGRIDVHLLNPAWLAESRGLAIEQGPFTFAGLFEFANGGNQGFRRSVVEKHGGFDQRFVPGEDVEFSFRLWRAGITVHYVDDALLHYRYRGSMRELWNQARSYARIQPSLLRMVRDARCDVPRDREWRRWLWLVRHLGSVSTMSGRARWISLAGGRVGRLEGSAKLLMGRAR